MVKVVIFTVTEVGSPLVAAKETSTLPVPRPFTKGTSVFEGDGVP